MALCTGVGKTTGSVCACASSSGSSATSLSVPVDGSATYHWKLKKRSLAAFSTRKRYDFGCSVTSG